MRSASAEQSTFYRDDDGSAKDARSKLSFEVSDHLAQHLTLLSSPRDLISEVELERKRKFHLLIQRYISQIQYGCKNPSCTTPTCFSCRKRLAGSPVRKYTTLSARTLACFLADARDSEAALCPHEPVRPVESYDRISVDKTEHTLPRRTPAVSHLANGHVAQKRESGKQPTTPRASINNTATLENEDRIESQIPSFATRPSFQPSQRATRDPKSFTQALFDALPLKLLEWIPRTPERSTLHAYHLDPSQANHSAGPGPVPEQHKGSEFWKPIVQSTGHKLDPGHGSGGGAYQEATTLHMNGSVVVNGHAKEIATSALPKTLSSKMTLDNGGVNSSLPSLPISGDSCEVSADKSSRKQSDSSEGSHTPGSLGSDHQQSSSSPSEVNRFPSVPTLTSLSTEILEELIELYSKTEAGPSRSDLSGFFRQSLYYCLTDPCRLLASFAAPDLCDADSGAQSRSEQEDWLSRVNAQSVKINLRSMSLFCSWREIIRNLSIAIHSLQIPASLRRPPLPTSSLNDRQAARVCVIGLYALSQLARIAADSPDIAPANLLDQIRTEGRARSFPKSLQDYCDGFDNFESLSLLEKIVNVIANRWTFREISKAHRKTDSSNCEKKPPDVIQSILDYMADDANQMLKAMVEMKTSVERGGPNDLGPDILGSVLLSRLTLYWLRALMLRDWDGGTSVRKSDTVGSILQIIAAMYERHRDIGLDPAEFWTQVFVKRFDPFDMPMEWMAFRSDNKTVHLLSYSFLFPPETVVTYFRAINYSRMTKTTEGVALTKRAYDQFLASAPSCQIPVSGRDTLEQRLGIIGLPRFVIEVRRDHVLTDAIDQIWRRHKRELLKPLKVRMGTNEGEEGVDSGGVQQELFRVLFAEALDPSYGMFTVDEETRMTWFQPRSFEPLFKFEALGILMSLAVYNSITLPITFPLAFYRKLLGLKVKTLAHIADGWPMLARNLQGLLDWEDEDVAEVFTRTYEFSYEAFGKPASIDMELNKRDMPWPPQPTRKGKEKTKTASFDVPPVQSGEESAVPISNSASRAGDATTEDSDQGGEFEASLVTNANREQYVKDYIFWLTDKSIRPQYEAFARGFYTCLDRTALSIFTAEALQSFVEGVQEIDINGLQTSTVYDGYTAEDQEVKWFWEVVKSWDHQKKKLLLEFITASDRVPVNGVSVIGLVIQCAGRSDEILPRSMTCFATFLLPLYSSKEVLERMLGIAIEHAKGFGTI